MWSSRTRYSINQSRGYDEVVHNKRDKRVTNSCHTDCTCLLEKLVKICSSSGATLDTK